MRKDRRLGEDMMKLEEDLSRVKGDPFVTT